MTDAEILCAAVKIMSRDYEHLPQEALIEAAAMKILEERKRGEIERLCSATV